MNSEQKKQRAKQLIPAMMELRQRAMELEKTHTADIQLADPEYQASARNLIHYLAIRQTDMRQIQKELVNLGLTSLGKSELAVLCALDTVLANLHTLAGEPYESVESQLPVTNESGPLVLAKHTEQLLGEPSGKRKVSIMVTMPSEAATDKQLIKDLLAAGMDLVRINCAHDDQEAWTAMIKNLRRAERDLGRPCKIYADLAGPKLRTGPVKPVGKIVKYRPRRNYRGQVVQMGHVWFTPSDEPQAMPPEADVTIPIDGYFLEAVSLGDEIHLVDARGRRRRLTVIQLSGNSCLAETDRTHYVETGMVVRLLCEGEMIAEGVIGDLPELVQPIPLNKGDTLILTREDIPGEPALVDEKGHVIQPAHISITLKEAFDAVQPGQRILFDDGKIHGRILENDRDNISVEITNTGPKEGRLRPEKGINFPDTTFTMPSLTAKDLEDLAFMAKHADIVGLSFVRNPSDVIALEQQLDRLKAFNVGVVLKIETRKGFENLPRLLLTTMRKPPDGVMVARGDLAAEVGFERMAEVQEEILWFCEAAHIPVIWATQVLESLAKRGTPSRAEVTDVVMSGRAECVMLNKGPYIVDAVHFLNGVLERMAAHRSKRRSTLRRLAISEV